MSHALASARQTVAYVRLLERERAKLAKEVKQLRDRLKRAEQVAQSGQKD